MNILRRNIDFKSLRLFRLYSLIKKSHYEILNLPRNCTDKDIKRAFIKLSKEYHPDKNKDVKAQEQFVRIVEAYNVLGKPSSRAKYDNVTEIHASNPNYEYVYRPHVPYNLRNNPQYSYYWDNHDSSKGKQNRTFYQGTKVKRQPNYVIVLVCCGVAVVGLIIQMAVIRQTFSIRQRQADTKSQLIAEELNRVRSAALENGNDRQTQLLLDKIAIGSTPTVATAALGQALANERK